MDKDLSKTIINKPLGELLAEAGLISVYQIDVALQDQIYNSSLKIGEILALRNWIAQETADFFAMDFPVIISQKNRRRIGFYLKKAKLLTQKQIDLILVEQKNNWIPFTCLAVLKGYLPQQILTLFEKYLFNIFPNKRDSFSSHTTHSKRQEDTWKYIKSENDTIKIEATDEIDLNEIKWID